MTTITCKCENSVEVQHPETYDLSGQPEVVDEVLSGRFLTLECPHCGAKLKPELQVVFIDPKQGLDLMLIPEKERGRYLLNPDLYKNHERVVIGYAELVEKIRGYRAGLDDRTIEIIKYYLYRKSGGDSSVTVRFGGMENHELLFEIHGMRDDEVGIARISQAFYDKMEHELPEKETEEPFCTILAPPYVSLSKVDLEEH